MSDLSPQEIEKIAEEAYIFAYPMLEHYRMMFGLAIYKDSPAFDAPFNQFTYKSNLYGPEFTAIVRPNNDTFYSSVWPDLRVEPVVLSVPAIEDGRYYSFQMIDMYTHNFAYIGTRTTGFGTGNYMIAGPDWDGEKPPGVDQVFQCETNFPICLGRTAVFGKEDVPNAIAVQKQFKAVPLSQFLGQDAPPTMPPPAFPIWNPQQVQSAGFISYFNFLLGQVKLHPSETALIERFAKIGVAPGQPFNPDDLDSETRAAIEAGIASAIEKYEAEAAKLGSYKDGWMLVSGVVGNREMMQGKYLTRAAAAYFGLWGNDLGEAFYPECSTDADGEALDCSKNNYMLHFEADQLPPVKAFWSLSMYKLPEQLFIENPINRYTIGDRTPGLSYGQDGSLTLYFQYDSPGADKQSNWLPAPDGPFSLQARLYWPKPETLDPLYGPPPIVRVD
jgi:hypothetical protein